MHRCLRLAAVSVFLLAGCAEAPIRHVAMDASRVTALPASVRVQCAYRVAEVEDARHSGALAGGLGANVFLFPDAAAVVREQLLLAGLSQTEGVPVRLRILHLYLTQNTVKVPVAVYQLGIGGAPMALIRAQPTSANWASGENEAYRAYAAAMRGAMQQVIAQLNAAC